MTEDKEHEADAEPGSGSAGEPDETESSAPPDATDAAAAAAGDEQAAMPPPAAARSRMPLLLAALALLLALVAAGGVVLLWAADRGPDELTVANQAALERLSDTLDGLGNIADRVRDNEQALAGLRSSGSEIGRELEDLSRRLEQRLQPLESLPGRLANLESQLAALKGVAGGLRDTWLLAEAEYYLQIANAQLTLADNVQVARTALTLADERLAELANPALSGVRQQIANELRQLEAVDTVDLESTALTLAGLAGTTGSLPLRTDVVRPDFDDPEVSEDLSGMQRAWAAIKSSLSDVISVRRSDRPVKPLLPPDAAYFLRSNLALQLQAARIALLSGEQEIYTQSLDDAALWIRDYYDPDSTPVKSALATIEELREVNVTVPLPDISGSLEMLRQQVALQSRQRRTTDDADRDNGTGQ